MQHQLIFCRSSLGTKEWWKSKCYGIQADFFYSQAKKGENSEGRPKEMEGTHQEEKLEAKDSSEKSSYNINASKNVHLFIHIDTLQLFPS